MMSRVAIALCLMLSLSGASLASGPSESGSKAEDAGATDVAPDPSAASSEGEDAGEATDQTESDDQDTAPIDVHRHRPGACPEGPPCKGGD
jgi:hypothetical protein